MVNNTRTLSVNLNGGLVAWVNESATGRNWKVLARRVDEQGDHDAKTTDEH